ncbi:MAG: SDR family NAD(P)-dependent oxidoreductase [Pseudomonadota bacterium]|nr:SDR family NAD(P)-dependent oxidoreductase [Pseudomonadota bacterium]MEC8497139.1 SDR family NAD(P)-dependent oxidoreductase [Pseudomonadota bacterium]|tara:strand:+ start:4651 stop:5412 length:762 start_codon:yes stop_codon:yes gene_type:complete
MPLPWKSVWITGASSGIGRELAIQLASQNVEIYASARRFDELQILSSINNNIHSINLDVSKIKDVRKKTKFFFEDGNFPDLVILNAGVSRLFTLDKIDEKHQDIIDSMDTNYFGVINCLSVILPRMIERKKGHIAIMSSVAGYRGLPNSVAYSPTKAALINLVEIMRSELSPLGINISIINPGFVDTDATKVNKFRMPSMVSVEFAARKIIRDLVKLKYEVAFPFMFTFFIKFLRILPNTLYFYIIRKLVWKS